MKTQSASTTAGLDRGADGATTTVEAREALTTSTDPLMANNQLAPGSGAADAGGLSGDANRSLVLARGVLGATTICPRIIREAVLAAHDQEASPARRLYYIAAARRLLRALDGELQAVELWLEREGSRP